MSTVSIIGEQKTKPDFLSGPNLCSQVGVNVSKALHAALQEKCGLNDGQLSLADIDHVFDLVLNSSELFPLYQHAYSTCVSLNKKAQFDGVDEKKVMNFVVGVFRRDVIKGLVSEYKEHEHYQSKGWNRAFIQGFSDFLASEIDPEARSHLFSDYQRLVLQHGRSLTPVTILDSEEILKTFAKTMYSMRVKLYSNPKMAVQLGWVINNTIITELEPENHEGGWVENTTINKFTKRIFAPCDNNPFHYLVLQSVNSGA